MPSIIPSYVYALFASAIVGTIIVSACGLSISNVKRQAEEQQLSSITNYIASESLQLISETAPENLTTTILLNLPTSIGGQTYWVRLANDTTTAWVDVGFGVPAEADGNRMIMPSDVSASGTFRSSYGFALLRCYSDSEGVHLTIMEAS